MIRWHAPSPSPPPPPPPPPPSKKLKILLVGHGNMSIPPNGWGAVESLIYEYYCQLKVLGHDVSILNTRDFDNIVEDIRMNAYDYVHLHNDILINIVDRFPKTTNVVLTSHYPYIHDPSKWNDLESGYNYGKFVMTPLLRQAQRVHVCAVSQKDRDAFVSYGVPTSSVSICLNGFNAARFNVVPDVSADNAVTICLSQIIKRKRHNLLYGIPGIAYVGKLNDASLTPPAGSQYLGEWTDAEKHAKLTNYANAILVSDGENGTPLSIKESLAVGLGCVISEAVASEIPADWFWVNVIPESRIHDAEFIRMSCETNRMITSAVRATIREKAVALWDWSLLVPLYLAKITNAFGLDAPVSMPTDLK
jgi:hypothetical protein